MYWIDKGDYYECDNCGYKSNVVYCECPACCHEKEGVDHTINAKNSTYNMETLQKIIDIIKTNDMLKATTSFYVFKVLFDRGYLDD